jgi:SAM-dependent methyltransferase
MEVPENPTAPEEDVKIGGDSAHSINLQDANQNPSHQYTDTAIKEANQPFELPTSTAAEQACQDVPTSVPETEIHNAVEPTPPQSATPVTSEHTELPTSFASTRVPIDDPEADVAIQCTATITNPSELLVQPYQDVNIGLNDDTAMAEQSDGPSDATTQAHLIMAAAAPPAAQLPGVVTQIAPAMQPDNDLSDEAYAESTTTSFVTSIKSEVSRGVLENERLYPSYGQHDYGMPIDEDELDRMDLQHRKYEMVIGDKHFLAPIGPTPQRILDLGTGTGIWALDVADMYPSAQVIGVDIAPIQPKWIASNCQFEIDDVEETWTFKHDSFDFIHFRDPLYVVRNWPRLMEQCYTHTKPGGWCELACIYPVPMCDDGTMPADSGFKVICDKFIEASYLFGAPADCPLRFSEYLRNAGFINVAEHIFKVPSSPWPKNKRLKQIGALEMTNVVEGATAFGLRAFEKVFGWTKDQTELVMVNFRRDVKNRHYHQYCQ